MDELIRKQDAIKAICEDGTWLESQGCTEITMAERKQRDADILSELPPVQPEIIHCKDCEHASDNYYCHCKYVTWWNKPDDYCSRAEKRGDKDGTD